MLSETAEPAAESLPDRGKHGSFPAATAWTVDGAASIPVVPSFVFSRFTRLIQPPFAGFVNLWAPGQRRRGPGRFPCCGVVEDLELAGARDMRAMGRKLSCRTNPPSPGYGAASCGRSEYPSLKLCMTHIFSISINHTGTAKHGVQSVKRPLPIAAAILSRWGESPSSPFQYPEGIMETLASLQDFDMGSRDSHPTGFSASFGFLAFSCISKRRQFGTSRRGCAKGSLGFLRQSHESNSVSRRDYGDSGLPSGLRYGLEGLSPHRLFGLPSDFISLPDRHEIVVVEQGVDEEFAGALERLFGRRDF